MSSHVCLKGWSISKTDAATAHAIHWMLDHIVQREIWEHHGTEPAVFF
jgi:hypothetical protein